MKLKKKLGLERASAITNSTSSVVRKAISDDFQAGWDAALDWAAENAECKPEYYDVIDVDSILAGKTVEAIV